MNRNQLIALGIAALVVTSLLAGISGIIGSYLLCVLIGTAVGVALMMAFGDKLPRKRVDTSTFDAMAGALGLTARGTAAEDAILEMCQDSVALKAALATRYDGLAADLGLAARGLAARDAILNMAHTHLTVVKEFTDWTASTSMAGTLKPFVDPAGNIPLLVGKIIRCWVKSYDINTEVSTKNTRLEGELVKANARAEQAEDMLNTANRRSTELLAQTRLTIISVQNELVAILNAQPGEVDAKVSALLNAGKGSKALTELGAKRTALEDEITRLRGDVATLGNRAQKAEERGDKAANDALDAMARVATAAVNTRSGNGNSQRPPRNTSPQASANA